MNAQEYKTLFEDIVNGRYTVPPYDDPYYLNYVKLNTARTNHWEKKGEISEGLKNVLEQIDKKQTWILITEPWCGDAANSVPLIEKMAQLNHNINLDIELRDSGSQIEDYLTNGGKSIPKLIVRDDDGNDLFVWGPRPKETQELVIKQKDLDLTQDEKYTTILQWYLKDKGVSIQEEIRDLISAVDVS